MRVFKIGENKVEVIPNYIDTKKFAPTEAKKENRAIFVGRLEKVKNLHNLISAMKGLRIDLVLAGEGSQRAELEMRARKEGINNVSFLGTITQEKLPEELNKSRLFILPSLHEGNPKSLLEAMSCGVPCIGTDVKGINSIIKNRENGLLCGTDAKSIHAAIINLLADPDLEKKLGEGARKTILDNFSLEKALEKEINLYKSL